MIFTLYSIKCSICKSHIGMELAEHNE